MASEYIPGVCNIGRKEVQMRKVAGILGLVCVVLLLGTFVVVKTEPLWRLVVFLPAFLAALGFLQAQLGFCVKYGFGGVFSFGPDVGKTDTVEQAEFRRQDRRKAVVILAASFAMAAAVAAAAYFIPF